MIIEERERKIILYSSLCFQSPEFEPITWYLLLCLLLWPTLIGTSMSDQQRNKRNSKKKKKSAIQVVIMGLQLTKLIF